MTNAYERPPPSPNRRATDMAGELEGRVCLGGTLNLSYFIKFHCIFYCILFIFIRHQNAYIKIIYKQVLKKSKDVTWWK